MSARAPLASALERSLAQVALRKQLLTAWEASLRRVDECRGEVILTAPAEAGRYLELAGGDARKALRHLPRSSWYATHVAPLLRAIAERDDERETRR